MPKLAAIDVGSNAFRLAIAALNEEGEMQVIHTSRESVRLGADVFSRYEISEDKLIEGIEAFIRFRKLLNEYKVKVVRAVGTSALREARNRSYFINQIAKATDISIDVISAEEEARLEHLAVSRAVDIQNKLALIVDIGGGSVEVTLATKKEIVATESFAIGTVRLLQLLEQKKRGEKVFRQLVQEYVKVTDARLRKEIADRKIDVCIATGGNVESLGDLRVEICKGKSNTSVTVEELDIIIKELEGRSYEGRIKDFKLRFDRADVIIPAALVLQNVAHLANVKEVLIPRVGVRDGLLIDMADKLRSEESEPLSRAQVITSAHLLGRKYDYEQQHATNVAHFALDLFDATTKLHRLGDDERLLLEVAALLHDVGYYISVTSHHKHSYYIINSSPLIGLDEVQKALIANVARYHRRSVPKGNHREFYELTPKQRQIVLKLAAILRLAEAMDREHASRVKNVRVTYSRNDKFRIFLEGDGDMLLEKWALSRGCQLFEKTFKKRVQIE
jgi:exopolyphosphatase/guanosine-5'-triphosphate,3'-diphosphate pyrophosphatase